MRCSGTARNDYMKKGYDINCYKIRLANEMGITFKSKNGDLFIGFQECVQNLAIGQNCIGERDLTKFEFIFFTYPQNTCVRRLPNFKIFNGYNSNAFYKVCAIIEKFGYSTYD